MTEEFSQSDSNAEAQRLVGAFLQGFALLESAIDEGIGKLLGLDGGKLAIVCTNMAFQKKVDVFFSSENLLGAAPDSRRTKQLQKTRGAILKLNENTRVMFAHNSFVTADGGGIFFRRVVAHKKLKISDIILSFQNVVALCEEAEKLKTDIETLAMSMTPFEPSLDFSDPRNSGYLALF